MAERDEYMARPPHINNNVAKANHWGEGWPACEEHDPPLKSVLPLHFPHDTVKVRSEIAELVSVLFEATEKAHGYHIRDGATWGYDCRAVLDLHGNPTNTPSNHSWGLAVDVNSDTNPRQLTFQSDLPLAVVPMWWDCGFYWGGWYRNSPYDPMHFEYIHPATAVPGHLAKARNHLIGGFMPLHDDTDGRALIWRIHGILDMADPVDNHAGNPNEPNKLAQAITQAADRAKQAADAANHAQEAAEQAAEAAQAAQRAAEHPPPLDEAVLEATLERVVRRVLTAAKTEPQQTAPRQGDGSGV